MKKTLIIMLLLTTICQSQTILNPNPLSLTFRSRFSGQDTTGALSYHYFPQNKFTIGWQWGHHPRLTYELSSGMFQNTYDGQNTILDATPNYTPPEKIDAVVGIASCFPVFAQSIMYEPTLLIPEALRGTFITRENDPSDPIFGFANIRGRRPDNSSDPNYSRLILDSAALINNVVLSYPWICNELHLVDPDNDDNNNQFKNGMNWYVSINLRRLDSTDNSDGDDHILEIKLPYKLGQNSGSGYIKFDSIPDSRYFENINYNGSRGMAISMKDTDETVSSIIITKSMLPKATAGYHDITISAHFKCNGDSIIYNRYLKNNYEYVVATDKIDSLKIEVIYKNNVCPVAIDWIRIENPWARDVLRGRQDLIAYNGNASFKDGAQAVLNKTNSSNTYNFFRFYAMGGDDGLIIWNWGVMRYLQSLFGNLVTSSIPQTYSEHYHHYVGGADRWTTGISLKNDCDFLARPYYQPTTINDDFETTFGHHFCSGFKGLSQYWENGDPMYIKADTLNSFYETYSKFGSNGSTDQVHTTDTLFLQYLQNLSLNNFADFLQCKMSSIQAIREFGAVNYYKYKDFLYNGQPWWAQLFVMSEWHYRKTDNNFRYFDRVFTFVHRPQTGEEIKLNLFNPIILGAKGLCYDRQQSWYVLPDSQNTAAQKEEYFISKGVDVTSAIGELTAIGVTGGDPMTIPSNVTGWDFINRPELEGDYLTASESTRLNQYLNIPVLANFLGVPQNRIYMGRLSQRREMKKIHQWIRENDSLLMRLRLVSWYGKGFKTFRSADEANFPLNILDDYIDTSRIKTRPIGRVDQSGQPYYEQHSAIDSGFYDISILRDSADHGLNSGTIFMGVQNRRTDPLVRPIDSICWRIEDEQSGVQYFWYKDSSMKFYSTAEFDKFVHDGGDIAGVPPNDTIDYGGGKYEYYIYDRFRDSTYWQGLYMKRLGCREITIPFKYVYDPKNPDNYALLKITELGYDNEELNNQPWRDAKYYHKIDTIIGQEGSLVLRLLPGEGRMIKIVPISQAPAQFAGKLEYSNQRKIVSYPIKNNNGELNYDSIRFHMVYFRYDNGRNKVYYRRSFPVYMTVQSSDPNVFWEEPLLISDSIDCASCQGDNADIQTNCGYPSIVVRESNQSIRVYVVYACDAIRDQCFDPDLVNQDPARSESMIVETILDADSKAILNKKVIALAAGRYDAEWGTPMINASSRGNFFTWADSIRHIGIGWKYPDSTCLNDIDYVYRYSNRTSSHPSLNTYSRITSGENECALVFEETDYTDLSKTNIYYTRLLEDQANIYKQKMRFSIPMFQFLNADSTVLRINQGGDTWDNKYPVISRAVEKVLSSDLDKIAWQGTYGSDNCCIAPPDTPFCEILTKINYQGINTINTGTEDVSVLLTPMYVAHDSSDLVNPDITQGNMLLSQGSNISPKSWILEYNRSQDCHVDSSIYLKIGHLPHNESGFNPTTPYWVSGNGYLPHLSARLHLDGKLWKLRRIFNKVDEGIALDSVLTSAQYFYKGVKREAVPVLFSGFSDGSNSYQISECSVNGEKIAFDFMDIFRDKEEYYRERLRGYTPDTVKTEWFSIRNSSDIDFIVKGMDLNKIEVSIQKRSNLRSLLLPVGNLSTYKKVPVKFNLINQSEDSYRLLYINKIPSEMSYTGGIIYTTDPYFTAFDKSSENSIIDLGILNSPGNNLGRQELAISPNPAENVLYVTACNGMKTKTRLKVSIYTSLSDLVDEYEVNSCETATIPTAGLPPGVYFVRVDNLLGTFVKM